MEVDGDTTISTPILTADTLLTTAVSFANNNNNNNNNTSTTLSADSSQRFPDGEPSDKLIFQVTLWIIRLGFPVLVLVGTWGNGMVLVVLKRGAISTDNLVFFLSVLALVDTVFLYSSCFKTWLRVVTDFELLHLGSWSCKLILFLTQLSLSLSAWLMVIITWQRWYTCAQPFHRCCPTESIRWGYLGLACLLLVLLGANSYILFTAQLHEEEYGYICAPKADLDETIGSIFPIVMVVLYSGTPAVLLFLLNGLLVHVLYRSRRALLTNNNASRSTGREDEVRARYNHVTVMLVALSACWFVLAIPHTILKQVEIYPVTAQQSAANFFFNVMAYILLYLNHSINFFIYCTLMRSFRREVKHILSQFKSCLSCALPANCSASSGDSLTEIAGRARSPHSPHSPHNNHHLLRLCHPHPHHHHRCQINLGPHPHHSQTNSSRPLIVKYHRPGELGDKNCGTHSKL